MNIGGFCLPFLQRSRVLRRYLYEIPQHVVVPDLQRPYTGRIRILLL